MGLGMYPPPPPGGPDWTDGFADVDFGGVYAGSTIAEQVALATAETLDATHLRKLTAANHVILHGPCPKCGKDAEWFGMHNEQTMGTKYTISHEGPC